ncbi:hypothetical protein H4I96_09402 [Botrytis cinerea]
MSSTDFSSLTKLPAEIRLQVWRLAAENALNPPRAIIELRNGLPRTIPVLSINAEARDEALSHTDLRSIPRFSLPEDRGRSGARTNFPPKPHPEHMFLPPHERHQNQDRGQPFTIGVAPNWILYRLFP